MSDALPVTWPLDSLFRAPATRPAPDAWERPGVEAVLFESVPWRGRPTRVFAWMGVPQAEGPVPGVVLVHGGGGTAFAEWVRLWNERGYAAISMDTCGCLPGGEHGRRPRHDDGGPGGWGGWDQLDEPVRNQWGYHAVAAVLLAHSLLAAQPGVDAERIGLTGISWGGVLTSIVAGVDPRLRFAAPVYGCGHLGGANDWPAWIMNGDRERAERWLSLWDPQHYLAAADLPLLWVSGTNDFAFSLAALRASAATAPGPSTFSIRLRMPHGQEPGARPEEIAAFADGHLCGGEGLPAVGAPQRDGDRVHAAFDAPRPPAGAHLLFTRATTGAWRDREWEQAPAALADGCIEARLPDGAESWILNLEDDQGRVVGTEPVLG